MLSLLGSILPLFVNVPVALTIGAVVLGALAIVLIEGWPALLKDALNPRYWLVIAGAVGLAAFLHAGNTIEQQKKDAAVAQATITAQQDSATVTQHLTAHKQQNAAISSHLQRVIRQAPVGAREDAVWDAIADAEDQP